jgi:hypothetical protein
MTRVDKHEEYYFTTGGVPRTEGQCVMKLVPLLKILVPVAILAAFWFLHATPYDNWSSLKYLALSATLASYVTALLRGRVRVFAMIVVTVLLVLAGIEAYSVAVAAGPVDFRPPGYSVSRPILGWGAEHPGVFHHVKLAAHTRKVIFDVNYTVDKDLNRQVISADSGPTVAFFGDSFTFGTGLNDKDTLPQVFADLYDRKLRVLNFGFPGYGPQQFLRALETNMYDPLLRGNTRLFVYETAAWHAERTACTAGFMLRAPRYALIDGKPVYQGTCYQHWSSLLGELFANTALYHVFVEGAIGGPSHADIDLDVAVLARAGELAREKYRAPTLILYMRSDPRYLRRSGYTDAEIMQHMRDVGLDVIDATLKPADFPGQPLTIPGDGHSTGVANRARAEMAKAYLERARPNLFAAVSNDKGVIHMTAGVSFREPKSLPHIGRF